MTEKTTASSPPESPIPAAIGVPVSIECFRNTWGYAVPRGMRPEEFVPKTTYFRNARALRKGDHLVLRDSDLTWEAEFLIVAAVDGEHHILRPLRAVEFAPVEGQPS